jgi:acyl-CoA reductase-like NAD-dependent aldehyde dehydrogenase
MSAAEEAGQRARRAQPAWAARGLPERLDVLRRFRALVDAGRDDLARVLTGETHKPIAQARNELAGVLSRIDFFVESAPDVLAPATVLDDRSGLREQISYEPLGVVLNISAWNYPWFVGSNVFVPALLAGNAVVYKPSEHALLVGESIAATLHEAGVPRDVFVEVGGGPEVGAELLDQPIDGVFFTGSYATGRRIAETMAGRMVPVQLELGGKDPVYVADDVDPRAAAAGLADGAFYNNGQSCCSVERIYVHERVFDAFVDAFVETVEQFPVGDPLDETTYVAPLTREQQLDVLDEQLADAVAKGAVVRRGGGRVAAGRGTAFAPTVLTDVDHSMAVMRDESFGPIIGIQRVASDDEAVELMNDTEYGLTAGVYSRDEARARAVLERVDAGSAYWNCCDRVSPRLPWSGRNHSGIGTTLSTLGIQAFVKPKAWHLREPG